jgi:hypothetical protein
LQTCSTSADCAYLDNTYFPIESYEIQYVTTQDCSVITPLPVANKALALAHQNELLKARETAREVCGARIARASCTGAVGFQSNQAAPVCDAGVCRINPAILGN